MFINKIPSNVNTFECDDEIAKKIYQDLHVLPINVYGFPAIGKNVNVFILSKKLLKYLKETKIGGEIK